GGTRACTLRGAVLIGNGSCGAESGGQGNVLEDLLCVGNGYAGVSLSQNGQTLRNSRLVANGSSERPDAGFGLVLMHRNHTVERCEMRGNAHYGVYLYPDAKSVVLKGCTVQGNCVGPRSEAVAEVRLSKGAQARLEACTIAAGGSWRTVRASLSRDAKGGWTLRPLEPSEHGWEAYQQTQARCVDPGFTLWLQGLASGAFACRPTSGSPRPGSHTVAIGSRARYGVFESSEAEASLQGDPPFGFPVPILRQ
ncbi:MAG: right-handed parallel beta-helix repeat-containing protein, partial [Fimbriimonadales bacterium]|nr:right-handed parallel beta-helix repeat-containing protein [Fimbriimonadales bacterium]